MSATSLTEQDLAGGYDLLARTPQVLRALLAGMPAHWLDATEGPGTWSPRIIVAHLLYCERANWMPRAHTIREHGGTVPFPPFTPDGHFHARYTANGDGPALADAPLDALLASFTTERAQHLAVLESWQLTSHDLTREGLHPAFGTVTLGQLLAAWVAHDLSHIAQVTRVLARQYRDVVGPWRKMMPLLDR